MKAIHTRLITAAAIVILSYAPLFGKLTIADARAQAVQNTTSQFMYESSGVLNWIFLPLSRTRKFTYDPLNRLKNDGMITDYGASNPPFIQYGYDGLDQIETVTDARNLVTRYTVDGLGNQLKLASPDTGTTQATYDLEGNLQTRTDARGVVSSYGYDALNRLMRVDYVGWPSTVYEYDGGPGGAPTLQGKLTRITDESGATTFAYDARSRLIGKSQNVTVGGVSNTHSAQYAYGTSGITAGKLTSMTYPSGNRVNYTYDSAGKLSGISLNPVAANGVGTDMGTTIVLVKEITYAPFGNVKGWSWGNSSETAVNGYARTYDLDGRVTSYNLGNALTTGTLRTVAYDAGSRIISYTHTGASTTPVPSSLNQTFGYDVTDRLKSNGSATTNRSYSYDNSGNRTNFGIGSSNYANTISATSNRLMATAGPLPAKTNSFDAAGNLLSDGTVTYTYNPRNRMRSSTVAGVTVTQLYNGLGQRVQRSGSPGIFVYDENGQLVGEYNGATGAKVRETVYLGDLPIAVLKPVSAGNEPSPTVATEVYYVFPDHLGTPRVITAASDGAIVWRWDQGDASGLTPPNENPVGRGMFTFNLRMPGQYHDRENNLFYNYYRDYDPQTGRYVQSDPIGLDGGINTYGYVEGNPLSLTDPFGLQVAVPVGPLLVGVAGIILYNAIKGPTKAPGGSFPSDVSGPPLEKRPSGGWLPPPVPPENMSDRYPSHDNPKGQCSYWYQKCMAERWNGRCGDCMNKCTAQNEWPFGKGPGFCSPKVKKNSCEAGDL